MRNIFAFCLGRGEWQSLVLCIMSRNMPYYYLLYQLAFPFQMIYSLVGKRHLITTCERMMREQIIFALSKGSGLSSSLHLNFPNNFHSFPSFGRDGTNKSTHTHTFYWHFQYLSSTQSHRRTNIHNIIIIIIVMQYRARKCHKALTNIK